MSKEMDLSSGALNFSGVEMLRTIEGLEKRERGFMSYKWHVQSVQLLLAKHATRLAPFECELTATGECVTFDCKQLIKIVMKVH